MVVQSMVNKETFVVKVSRLVLIHKTSFCPNYSISVYQRNVEHTWIHSTTTIHCLAVNVN